ncbi:MAG: ComEC/Rec2 family competence protein [Patescibacteria group bacterium]|nr:ComEC/Rec2 family competence protein [Patescibacteria group bacterium]MDE2015064.1 ComEC/Rec2 family competence protein [Patescibacteria group bacterium]MDE2226492.1 ComEC/Rec2 family competence protein [Patescibacteria group bacterium]
MPSHLIFFLCALSFLSGIAFAAMGLPFVLTLVPAAILFSVIYICGERARLALIGALILLSGSFYYFLNDYSYRILVLNVPKSGEVNGLVVSDPVFSNNSQSFYLETDFGKLEIRTAQEPVYEYGDTIKVAGSISVPPQSYYGDYLAKENVVGTMYNPNISLLSSNGGNRIMAFFFGLKNNIKSSFKEIFSPDEAALLSGIILGVNEDFSKNFLQNLSLSGVRHITVISGLHMSIVMFIVFLSLVYVLPRRYAFTITLFIAAFFVALTGFSLSAVRAALMGSIAGLAREVGRIYSPYNALVLAALILVVPNPKILVFDVGFQLSFLAVVAMIYLSPLLRRALRFGNGNGFLNWKASLLATLAAQIATAPILITQFQNFSLIAFAANILILSVVPLIIILGFLIATFSFFFLPMAHLVGFLAAPIIEYVIFIVNLFANSAVLFNPSLGFTGIVLYYAVLIFIMYKFHGEKLAD